jgi:hypothetical protein
MLGEREAGQLRRLVDGADVDMEDIVGYAVQRQLLGEIPLTGRAPGAAGR